MLHQPLYKARRGGPFVQSIMGATENSRARFAGLMRSRRSQPDDI